MSTIEEFSESIRLLDGRLVRVQGRTVTVDAIHKCTLDKDVTDSDLTRECVRLNGQIIVQSSADARKRTSAASSPSNENPAKKYITEHKQDTVVTVEPVSEEADENDVAVLSHSDLTALHFIDVSQRSAVVDWESRDAVGSGTISIQQLGCRKCRLFMRDTLTLPCAHVSLCATCARLPGALEKCYTCDKPILRVHVVRL